MRLFHRNLSKPSAKSVNSRREVQSLELLEGRLMMSGDQSLFTFPANSGLGHPMDGVVAANGNLYGVSSANDLFEFNVSKNTASRVASVPSTSNPLISEGDYIYGTSDTGGGDGMGEVFEFNTDTNKLTVLASFDGTNGALACGKLLDVNGVLYGTTQEGGAYCQGSIYAVFTGGGSINTLFSFQDENGSLPDAGLTDVGGILYGTTTAGGSGPTAGGTLYQFNPATGKEKVLATFNFKSGVDPAAELTAFGGNLFGTTEGGGSAGDGTLFEYNLIGPTHGLTTLATFHGSNGMCPSGALIVYNGDLYGTTLEGGGSHGQDGGTIFKYDFGSALESVAATFQLDGDNLITPSALTDVNGSVFGTTELTNGNGMLYELT